MVKLIKTLALEFPTYGYRRLWALLRFKHKLSVNVKKVHRLCKTLGLQVSTRKKTPRPRAKTMRSVAKVSNERWANDATSFDCGVDGLGCLIAVIDCCDRQIVGWHLATRGRAKEAVAAIEDACLGRFGMLFDGEEKRPMLRSDNGLIFHSRDFRRSCREFGLGQEFITPYTPKQNGMIERFFRSLKEECIWQQLFTDFKEAKELIARWIEFYNAERPHQALKYRSPNDVAPAPMCAA